jgi:cytolysin-activating lysine-acyltransferase
VGQVVLALGAVPRYRHQSIADLPSLVLETLMRKRVSQRPACWYSAPEL